MSIKVYETTRRWLRNLFSAAATLASLTAAQLEEVIDSVINVHLEQWKKDAADAAAATTTAANHFFENKTGRQLEVTSVTILPDGTVTANDTNYATITLEREDGAAGGKETVAVITTKITGGSGDWAAGVPVTLTITSANRFIDPDAVLSMKIAKAASGVAIPASVATVKMEEYADAA